MSGLMAGPRRRTHTHPRVSKTKSLLGHTNENKLHAHTEPTKDTPTEDTKRLTENNPTKCWTKRRSLAIFRAKLGKTRQPQGKSRGVSPQETPSRKLSEPARNTRKQ